MYSGQLIQETEKIVLEVRTLKKKIGKAHDGYGLVELQEMYRRVVCRGDPSTQSRLSVLDDEAAVGACAKLDRDEASGRAHVGVLAADHAARR